MPTLFFKTADGKNVGTVRNVPGGRGALQQARAAMRVLHYVEITEAEYNAMKETILRRMTQPKPSNA